MTSAAELLVCVVATLIVAYLWGQRRPRHFPPGPWGVPILGAVPFLGVHSNKTLLKWKDKYGPIVGMDFMSWRCVAISDYRLMKECLNDPAYASRPPLPFMSDRSGGQAEGIIFTTGRKWQEQKRFTLRRLRDFGFGTRSMEAIVQEEIQELIERLREDAGKPIEIVNRFNAALVNALWAIVASERFSHDDPRLMEIVSLLTQQLSSFNLFTLIATFVPWFAHYAPNWLSGYSTVLGPVKYVKTFIRPFLDAHLATHIQGEPRDFIDTYIDEIKSTEDPDSSFHSSHKNSLPYVIYDLFMAGAETTSTTLTWIFLHLIRYPEVQEKLAAEIQRVVGNSRLPSLADRPNMPYTEAVIHEVMRCRILVPMTMQSTLEDVQLGGFFIPKNTMILFNLFAAHNDADLWGDPDKFRPERFLSEDGETFQRHDGFLSFSAGKRVCLGERLARDELFLFTATLFQVFRVQVDPDGPSVTLEARSAGILMPIPQKLVLTLR